MLSIGPLHLPAPYILAPMAGITDRPFRLVARRFGCPLAYTEMVSARALGFENWRTLALLSPAPGDRPLGVQLVGRDPDFLARAVDTLAGYPFDVLDLNAACPVHKVTRKGEGAALMREPAILFRLVAALVKAAPVPVTVKIRSGWDDGSVNAPEVAKVVEAAGASAVCVHGRTRNQGYGGRADTAVIKAVKEAVSIPVIASGDLFSAEAVKKTMEATGCDGVLIARGALGNPWIFRDLGIGRQPSPTAEEVKAIMRDHLALSVFYHGPEKGVIGFRKCFIWYSRGFPNARALRPKAVRVSAESEMTALIDQLQRPVSPGLSLPASPA